MTKLRAEFEQFKADLRHEGRKEGKAEALLSVLTARGLALSDALRAQILSCQDLATLDRWLARALTAQTATDVLSAA